MYHVEASPWLVRDQFNVHTLYYLLEHHLDTTFPEKTQAELKSQINKHNISFHLKQVSKQPVVTLGALKLPSLEKKNCLNLLSDV